MTRTSGCCRRSCVLASPAFAERHVDRMVRRTSPRPAALTPHGRSSRTTRSSSTAARTAAPSVPVRPTRAATTSSLVRTARSMLSRSRAPTRSGRQVLACVKDMFSLFNVNVTDVDPGTRESLRDHGRRLAEDARHVERSIGGVSPFTCNGAYIQNALVFDFANQFIGNPTRSATTPSRKICSTAAQEIAHAFSLDHVTDRVGPDDVLPVHGPPLLQERRRAVRQRLRRRPRPFGQTVHRPTATRARAPASRRRTRSRRMTGAVRHGPGTPPTVTITSPKTGDNVCARLPGRARRRPTTAPQRRRGRAPRRRHDRRHR